MRLPTNAVVDVAYAEAEVLGDYVITTVMSGRDVCCFYIVSWKTGVVTLVSSYLFSCASAAYVVVSSSLLPQLRDIELSNRWRPLWVPRLVDIDGDLMMLANCTKNSLEICKLELTSQEPRLHTICFLELPALEPYVFVVVSRVDKEWVPTSPHGARSQQQQQPPPRKRVVPFRSSKVGTIGLLVEHEMRSASVRVLPSCWMTVSVAALLSAIAGARCCPSPSDANPGEGDAAGNGDAAAGVRTLFWPEWGPAATRVLLSSHGGRLPKPAGPFWIASFSPLVIRDYDLLRMQSTPAATEEGDKSPSRSLFGPPVFKSTEVPGEHWVEGKVETHLPYRDLVARELYCVGVVADREWIIRISVRVRFCFWAFKPFFLSERRI